ncbi:MAG: succinate dehydrogenase, cytochrome b556 subunit [Thermomicrobiaceae bacterium]|nr:succinate dehydrogenase, cytochrome b556 subunit [Thermomicrobiaceae bacterium]
MRYLPLALVGILTLVAIVIVARPLVRNYGAQTRMWAWALNRIAGISITLFLFAHIYETTLLGWGADAYNDALAIYKTAWFRPFEVLLVGAVVYHAIYGVRVMLLDFWSAGTRYDWRLVVGGIVVILALMGPTAAIMLWSSYR